MTSSAGKDDLLKQLRRFRGQYRIRKRDRPEFNRLVRASWYADSTEEEIASASGKSGVTIRDLLFNRLHLRKRLDCGCYCQCPDREPKLTYYIGGEEDGPTETD